MSLPQPQPPEFTPSPALALLASMGFTTVSAIESAHDLTSLDTALDAVREYIHRRLGLGIGEIELLRYIHDQKGNAPPDIAILSGLLAHQVQWVHFQMSRGGNAKNACHPPIEVPA